MSDRPRPPKAVSLSENQIGYLYEGGVYSREKAWRRYRADLAKLS